MEKMDIDVSIKIFGYVSWDNYERYDVEAGEELVSRMRQKHFHSKRKKWREQSSILIEERDNDNVEEENIVTGKTIQTWNGMVSEHQTKLQRTLT